MIATTRAALIRSGEASEDAYGDPVTDNGVVDGFGDFPISIIERTRREFDEASDTWRTIRYFAGRHAFTVPTVAGDRIRDNVTGDFYVVEEVKRARRNLGGRSSATLKMKRSAA